MAKRRVNMTMDEKLYDSVKSHAERYGLSVSSAMSLLINDGLEYRGVMDAMPAMLELVRMAGTEQSIGIVGGNLTDDPEGS